MSGGSPIIIDVRAACREKRDGKGQWTYGFVSELLRRNISVKLLSDTPVPDEWKNASSEIIPGTGVRWHLHVAQWLKNNSSLRVYVSPSSYIVPFILAKSLPCIPVVHDLIAFRNEPHDRKATWIERFTLGRAVRNAAHVLTVSNATKEDLLRRYPSLPADKVTSIYAGPMDENVPQNEPDGKTILCIATLCPRKNQRRLVEAYASLPSDVRSQYTLMLVGSRGWHDADILSLVEKTPGVVWSDYVDVKTYAELLHHCTVFALPSLYEGFGMQILDALQRGIPILTSARGSLKEVVGDAAFTVDPENVSDIAKGLESLLRDSVHRTRLKEAGPMQAARYSWKRTADLFLGIPPPNA